MVALAVANVRSRPLGSFSDFTAHMDEHLDDAPGADLIVFPELVTAELLTLEPDAERLSMAQITRIARYTDGYVEYFARQAQARNQYILGGTHLVRHGDRFLNTAFLFGPDGVVTEHAKTHLFSGEASVDSIGQGDELHVVDLPFARVGIAICYEIEIPEFATALAERGADILVNPSLTTSAAGSWRVLHCAHARAVENQVFVASAQLFGDETAPLPGMYGVSAVIAPCDVPWQATPDGRLADSGPNTAATVMAAVELDDLRWARERGDAPTRADRARRKPLYEEWGRTVAGLDAERQ